MNNVKCLKHPKYNAVIYRRDRNKNVVTARCDICLLDEQLSDGWINQEEYDDQFIIIKSRLERRHE